MHGNFCSQFSFDILFKFLANHFNIITVDLRGAGRSTYNKKITDLKDLAIDLDLFLQAIKIEGKIILAGWSLGGIVAMHLALIKP